MDRHDLPSEPAGCAKRRNPTVRIIMGPLVADICVEPRRAKQDQRGADSIPINVSIGVRRFHPVRKPCHNGSTWESGTRGECVGSAAVCRRDVSFGPVSILSMLFVGSSTDRIILLCRVYVQLGCTTLKLVAVQPANKRKPACAWWNSRGPSKQWSCLLLVYAATRLDSMPPSMITPRPWSTYIDRELPR